jgi:hypothetical protein
MTSIFKISVLPTRIKRTDKTTLSTRGNPWKGKSAILLRYGAQ